MWMVSHPLPRATDTIQLDDDSIHVLGDVRRRATLAALGNSEGNLDLSGLSQQVTINEAGTELTAQNLESVMIELVHNHLPRLEDMDIIEYSHDEHGSSAESASSR